MPCSHLPPADLPDPLRVDDAHLTETVLLLARGIAADLGFDRLPVLADALEDAGCDNFALLNHLRSSEPHRVECWALRRLLRTTLMLPGNVPMVFAYCPPGTFLMGSDHPDAEDDERPVHQVTLTRGFYAGIYPVTQGQWRAVMGDDPDNRDGDLFPASSISRYTAKPFCEMVTTVTAIKVRLPSEAEWEYACRAGTSTEYHYGDDPREDMMNCEPGCTPVGSFPPNSWGLFDFHGNVMEWCKDWYKRYPKRPVIDPVVLESSGTGIVCRGAPAYMDSSVPEQARSAYRYRQTAKCASVENGLRVVFTAT